MIFEDFTYWYILRASQVSLNEHQEIPVTEYLPGIGDLELPWIYQCARGELVRVINYIWFSYKESWYFLSASVTVNEHQEIPGFSLRAAT